MISEPDGGQVAILCPDGEDPSAYDSVIAHGGGQPLHLIGDWDDSAGGLLVIGEAPFTESHVSIIARAVDSGVPVLGVAYGMHVLNAALGGRSPVEIPEPEGKNGKHTIFISPGAKLSYTIGGSGWVSVPFTNEIGIRPAELAPGMLASCYREDSFVAAFEKPGRNWVIGVQWDAHRIGTLPKGFDSLLLALCERSEGE